MKKLFFLGLSSLLLFSCSSDEPIDNSGENKNGHSTANKELITLKSGAVVEKIGNDYVYSGDILLSEKQLRLLDETGSMFPELPVEGLKEIKDVGIPVDPMTGMTAYADPVTTRAAGRHPYQNMFWSMLRFTLPNTLSPSQKSTILSAMATIERETNVRFYNATGQPTRDPQYGFDYPYVEFQSSLTVNNSNVGRIGGKQIINIMDWSQDVIIHEICHALGMFHEQCRADRDNYINVNLNNVDSQKRHNFNKETQNYYMIGSFDFNSIMLYGSYAGSNNGKAVMTKKDGSTWSAGYYLSELDKSFLNYFYIPYVARPDVCAQLAPVVYGSDNKPLSAAQRTELERQLNINRCSYPLSKKY